MLGLLLHLASGWSPPLLSNLMLSFLFIRGGSEDRRSLSSLLSLSFRSRTLSPKPGRLDSSVSLLFTIGPATGE